mmetsp:Transcript_15029/g.36399  ORF Transcript_15029/g.36399 Transcript_15029/m.36399 type:complete len:440 (+) Transcript_15029:458-1777(+)
MGNDPVEGGVLVLAGCDVALPPLTVADRLVVPNGRNELIIHRLDSLVVHILVLRVSPVDVHRHAAHPTDVLTIVDEAKPRDSEGNDGRSAVKVGVLPSVCCPLFIVILQKPNELVLIVQVSLEVAHHGPGVPQLQAVVEGLVVTEVKALLLKLILPVPVALGNKLEVAVDPLGPLDGGRPELPLGPLLPKGAEALPPSLLQDILTHEHCHVTPHSVGQARNLLQDVAHLLPSSGVAIVDLHRVLPPVIVHILAVRKHLVPHLEEVLRLPPKAVLTALHKKLRLSLGPRVVDSHVVGHKVDDEAHPVRVHAVPEAREALIAPKVCVARVVGDGKRGGAGSLLGEALHAGVQVEELDRLLHPKIACLPHTQEIDHVVVLSNLGKLLLWVVIERRLLVQLLRKLPHHHPSVYLKESWVLGHGLERNRAGALEECIRPREAGG